MNKKYLTLFIIIFSIDSFSQEKFRFFQKKNQIEEKLSSKESYRYKTNFYNAIKSKFLGDYYESIEFFQKCISIDDNNPISYYEIAKLYYEIEEYGLALDFSKKSASIDEENKWYNELYAELLFINKDYLSSSKVYKNLIKNYPYNQDYYFDLVNVYLYSGKTQLAIETFNDLEKIQGITKQISIQKHRMYIDLRKFDQAANELKNCLKKFPEDIEIYTLLSDCYILDNNLDEAIYILEKMSQLTSNLGTSHLTLSDFYFQNQDYVNFYNELKLGFLSPQVDLNLKLKKIAPFLSKPLNPQYLSDTQLIHLTKILTEVHPKKIMANYVHADVLKSYEHLDSSLFYYKKLLSIDKNQQEIWTEMLLLEFQMQNYNLLVKDSEEAIDFFPTNPAVYYLNAIGNYRIDSLRSSIKSLNQGVMFVYNNNTLLAEMYGLLGDIYNELEAFHKSDSSYELSLKYYPENAQVLNNYSYYLSLREFNLEKAKLMSAKTLKISPEEYNYYDTYAWILFKMKDYEQAKHYMSIAVEKGGSNSSVIMDHMGDILFNLGEIETSKFYWEKAISLGGDEKILIKKINTGILND